MTIKNIEELAADLQNRLPHAFVNLFLGKRGAAMLSVKVQPHFFVMERFADGHYGVDELDSANSGFNMGYRHVFDDFDSATQKMFELLNSVASA
jgi:hypothetical protein